MLQVVPVQDFDVVVDHVSDIQPNLVEPQSLDFAVPGVSFDELVEFLAGVAEAADVFAELDDDFGTDPSGVADELEFVQAAAAGDVVACYCGWSARVAMCDCKRQDKRLDVQTPDGPTQAYQ